MRRIFLWALCAWAACGGPGRGADVVQLTLTSGAQLRAEVLKRTGERVILDLGYDTLSVPVSEIASEQAPGAAAFVAPGAAAAAVPGVAGAVVPGAAPSSAAEGGGKVAAPAVVPDSAPGGAQGAMPLAAAAASLANPAGPAGAAESSAKPVGAAGAAASGANAAGPEGVAASAAHPPAATSGPEGSGPTLAAPDQAAHARSGDAGGTGRELIVGLEDAVGLVSNAGGFGAGFVIDPKGWVLTNYHVVHGEKQNDVTLYLGQKGGEKEKHVFRKAEVRGYSVLMDVALLKIPDEDLKGITLPVLDLASSESVGSGIRVYAIGNPGIGAKVLDHTISQGILSSTNRNFDDILYAQTTAAVNPGNSGGPLVNGQGEVVGLVTFRAIWQEGLAFALPVSYLRHFVQNVDAYSPGVDTENTGYRYHDPLPGAEK
jgi:S1-C subfamily serine protease